MAGREHLDNLVFVVNCNLQRLDGPVRGNGKVIQEFEALFRGAGWNVIKVIWGRTWDDLLAKDVEGVLLNKMNSTVDGEFQKYATESGAYIREHFFGPDPRLQALVAHLSDEELQSLPRGGPRLPQALRRLQGRHRARRRTDRHPGQDHQGLDARPRDRGPQRHPPDQEDDQGPAPDPAQPPVPPRRDPRTRPRRRPAALLPPGSRREGRRVPGRAPPGAGRAPAQPGGAGRAPPPPGPGRRSPISWPGRVARRCRPPWPSPASCAPWCGTPSIGTRIVPIVSDEARTFGLESLISEVQIYAPEGQRYTPVDAGLALHYAESASGQVLQEGISEAGAVAAFTAAATSYATWGEPMIPFYLFYSMFGFQRVGDLLWALGDSRGRGFLLGLHGRPDHAQRRGPPAPGRALAAAGLDRPQRGRLRPRLLLRGGRHRRGRHPADDRSGARGPLLVPDAVQRELPDAGAARPTRSRPSGSAWAPSRACTASPLPTPWMMMPAPPGSPGMARRAGAGHPAVLRVGVAGGGGGPAAAGRRLGRATPTCGR